MSEKNYSSETCSCGSGAQSWQHTRACMLQGGTRLSAERPLDFAERRTRIRGRVYGPERGATRAYHNAADKPGNRIPPLVGPDCMGLLESALRILVGIQTNWNTELLEMSPDGRHCKLKHPGYIGWIMTDALLNLNGEGWLS